MFFSKKPGLIQLNFLNPDGSHTELHGQIGQSLMQAAVAAGLAGIAGDCGGVLACATCHVAVGGVVASRLAPPSATELSMLEFTATSKTANSRLSCQIMLSAELHGLTLKLPPSQY